jgi:dihydropteroate synthase
MHMLGEPGTMQQAPAYDDAALDIHDFLAARIAVCEEAGIARDRLIVDPGIGFGKTAGHNLELLRRLAVFHGLGCALMVGASRKRFIGALAARGEGDAAGRGVPPKERVAGSLAAALAAAARGAHLLRVHDVAETAQALAVWQAVAAA